MKKILVAVDGSEPALKAVRMAAELAKGAGATLVLAYVSAPNLLPPHAYPDVVRKLDEQEKKVASDLLKAATSEAVALGAGCEQLMLTGGPAEALADQAADPSVWMVAVGSRGRGAVSRVLLGSVADRLVHISPKPVLVVR
ncbi:MAG: universal stress protein [Myxococcaceae bacterium]